MFNKNTSNKTLILIFKTNQPFIYYNYFIYYCKYTYDQT